MVICYLFSSYKPSACFQYYNCKMLVITLTIVAVHVLNESVKNQLQLLVKILFSAIQSTLWLEQMYKAFEAGIRTYHFNELKNCRL